MKSMVNAIEAMYEHHYKCGKRAHVRRLWVDRTTKTKDLSYPKSILRSIDRACANFLKMAGASLNLLMKG